MAYRWLYDVLNPQGIAPTLIIVRAGLGLSIEQTSPTFTAPTTRLTEIQLHSEPNADPDQHENVSLQIRKVAEVHSDDRSKQGVGSSIRWHTRDEEANHRDCQSSRKETREL